MGLYADHGGDNGPPTLGPKGFGTAVPRVVLGLLFGRIPGDEIVAGGRDGAPTICRDCGIDYKHGKGWPYPRTLNHATCDRVLVVQVSLVQMQLKRRWPGRSHGTIGALPRAALWPSASCGICLMSPDAFLRATGGEASAPLPRLLEEKLQGRDSVFVPLR